MSPLAQTTFLSILVLLRCIELVTTLEVTLHIHNVGNHVPSLIGTDRALFSRL